MKTKQHALHATQEQRILECIEQERKLAAYYSEVLEDIGPDSARVMKILRGEHQKHIAALEQLLVDLEELREAALAIAD